MTTYFKVSGAHETTLLFHGLLIVCFNIVNNLSIISSNVFTLHPRPSPRHPHNQTLLQPFVKTQAHRHSFFVSVIPIWNSLPLDVVSSSNPFIFKSCLLIFFYVISFSTFIFYYLLIFFFFHLLVFLSTQWSLHLGVVSSFKPFTFKSCLLNYLCK